MLPWLCPMLPVLLWLCDALPMPDGSELLGELEPVCAIAKAVLNAVAKTNVLKYFVMPVSPRLVDRFWI